MRSGLVAMVLTALTLLGATRAEAQFVATMSELVRFHDVRTGARLYTIDRRDPALAGTSLRVEGIAAYVFGAQELTSVPLHRFVEARSGDRLYTLDPEARALRDADYRHEGICCYAFAEAIFGTVPLFAYVELATGRHVYTTDAVELRDHLAYRAEGIAAHVYPATAPLPLLTHGARAR
ncbi:MAG: hypothetical protein ABW252_19920 [Polyangiales bacterium]